MTQTTYTSLSTMAPQQAYAPSESGMSHRADVLAEDWTDERSNEVWVRSCILDYYYANSR